MSIQGVPLKKKDIIDAIKKNNGVIAFAAQQLDCERQTIYTWMKNDEDVNQAVKEAREEAIRSEEDFKCEIKELAKKSTCYLLQNNSQNVTLHILQSLFGINKLEKTETKIIGPDPILEEIKKNDGSSKGISVDESNRTS